ncbi:MAG: Formylglycine-generating sulfatase enzyme [Planctomycetes bacterium ADurb.Bin126]|nr:MAG: Formylglycine-generating sulfatase enzyme [Planctomycetes bacterium ADurb.Bin126]HOD83099.1 SUMF1/EgtB/PvdO family nonheme iron enzyme [Phycisphaerae bacterium]HQL71706.1 SUMF1/EgtB/PvdO family nonheme iron enzyme [Phycisphaerae bacterium]
MRLNALLTVMSLLLLAASRAPAGGRIEFEARDFDASNLRVSLTGHDYADGPSCIWNAGELPNYAEYEIDFPVSGEYALSILYAAQQARPVQIRLDDKTVHTGLAGTTGSWQTRSARWEPQCTLKIEKGWHALALFRDDCMPHICGIRLETPVAFPQGWQLKRLTDQQRAERARRAARRMRIRDQAASIEAIDTAAVRRAIDDMERSFPGRYDAASHRAAVERFERERPALLKAVADGAGDCAQAVEALLGGVRAALLANPLLDGDRLLVVRRSFPGQLARSAVSGDAGFVPHNYENHTSMRRGNWDNEIAVLSNLRGPSERVESGQLFKPAGGAILRDVCLDFDGGRMLFSSIDSRGRWAVFEIRADGSGLKQLSPTDFPDLDFFDACYLPDGRVVLCSTAAYQGLPCLDGNGQVANLFLLDPPAGTIRQLTFDQDNDNDPVILNDGQVSYQRWEYSDIPHYFSRRRFAMNPDGTGQTALYGSNSWFPTAYRFARPVPDHPSRLIGVISGHHDFGDCGRLALIDPSLAGAYPFRYRPTSKEWGVEGQAIALTPDVLPSGQTGFLQLIPGWGKPVAGTVCDAIVGHVYRKQHPALATHPWPLSSKYFLASMKPTPHSLWGIYLVDVFDNATLIAEVEGAGLFEPQPFAPRQRPPVIPDRVQPAARTAAVHVADVYAGPGLRGVPRGTVKALRVFSYHFGYNARAGFPAIGTQAGWDVKRILGTAVVEADGSAYFEIPANTPVSLQPLDDEGRAVQLMRSWLTGMPGEHVSCVGCHEKRGESLPLRKTLASRRLAQPLAPWFGPARPFAFAAEVYPVLEKYCIGCHNGKGMVGPRSKPSFANPQVAYDMLHPYVHRPGVESDMALLTPMEYHASTSRLIQMLEKGHHGRTLADLDRQARQRLYCWIDLNVPRNGRWTPPKFQDRDQRQRRIELARRFASINDDPEGECRAAEEAFADRGQLAFVPPRPQKPIPPDGLEIKGFPFSPAEAARMQQSAALRERTIDLGEGVKMELVRVPAGCFVMGSLDGPPDERPRAAVTIDKGFWMGVTEVTNAQYARFDPQHDTRYVDMHYMDRVTPGYIANHPDQPVARVSWDEAAAFCRWLARRAGQKASLPTEAQWEWAARAGSDTQFHFGAMDADFSPHANLADQSLRWFRMGYNGPSVLQVRYPYPPDNNFPLRDERLRDKWHVVDYVGQCKPNAWGLKDTVGNVSEWTASAYRVYPYADDGRNDPASRERRTARGGSWADRPADAGSSVRRAYQPWQKVHDVGFRVIMGD